LPAVDKSRGGFKLDRAAMAGDRGMTSKKYIPILKAAEGVGWITALRPTSVRSLVGQELSGFRLFNGYDLREFTSPENPD
jgi:hypothetical protein